MNRSVTLRKELGHLLPSEVAALLRASKWTLMAWRREGIGPKFIRFGRHSIRYSAYELQCWLTANSQGGAAGYCKFSNKRSRQAQPELKTA